MNTERLERMRKTMAEEGLEALVCRLPENVLLLSGYWPLCGWVFYLFPLEGEPACILPDTEEDEAVPELWDAECVSYPYGTIHAGDQYGEIENALRKVIGAKQWRHVGYEGGFESIAPAYNAAEQYIPAGATKQLLVSLFGDRGLIDATGMLNRERAQKTPFEIEKVRISNEIASIGLAAFAQSVDTGMRAVDLAASVEAAVLTEGTGYRLARRVRGFAQVAVGPETTHAWRPMEVTGERKLKKSEIALLEVAVVADGFWSDRTRARIAGRATDLQREVCDILEQAQRRAIETAGPGVESGDVDRAARKFIRDVGHEKDFMHITGHGVGFAYHEKIPCICPEGSDILQPGMIHTVEPGIYSEGFGGMRVEDEVVVTEHGCEILSPFSHAID
jgi:Xaa-Pro aminopeptidase